MKTVIPNSQLYYFLRFFTTTSAFIPFASIYQSRSSVSSTLRAKSGSRSSARAGAGTGAAGAASIVKQVSKIAWMLPMTAMCIASVILSKKKSSAVQSKSVVLVSQSVTGHWSLVTNKRCDTSIHNPNACDQIIQIQTQISDLLQLQFRFNSINLNRFDSIQFKIQNKDIHTPTVHI